MSGYNGLTMDHTGNGVKLQLRRLSGPEGHARAHVSISWPESGPDPAGNLNRAVDFGSATDVRKLLADLTAGQARGDWQDLVATAQQAMGVKASGALDGEQPSVADSVNYVYGADAEPPVPFGDVELPRFPLDSLPSWVADFVEAEAEATQTPLDVAGMLGLAVLSTACAKKIVVKPFEGYEEPVNLYVAAVQRPGTRKTRVFQDVSAPLREWERDETVRLQPEIAAMESKRRVMELSLKRAENEAAGKAENHAVDVEDLARELAAMKPSALPKLMVDDCSPEKLAVLLSEQSGRIAVWSPEGDVFDLMAGRYSSNGAPNFNVFLKGHAGDDLRVDRVNRPAVYVHNPAITLGVTVQPTVIHGLADRPSFRGRGLLGRFLYAIPEDLLGRRRVQTRPMPPFIRASWHHRVTGLLSIEPQVDDDGGVMPYVLRLDDDALSLWMGFAEYLEPQLRADGELGTMTDWASKLPGAVLRLAGLIHMANRIGLPTPWAMNVDVDTMSRAIALGEYLIPHARAAFGMMGADPALEDARYVWNIIARNEWEEFTQRELWQTARGRFERVSGLESALRILEERNYVTRVPPPQRDGPGRPPSHKYVLNPLARTQNAQNTRNSG